MLNFNNEYKERLARAWEKFINYEEHDYSFIRKEIYESWVRSRANHVIPKGFDPEVLSEKELKKRVKHNKVLIKTVRPYMEKLYSIVEGSGYYILLTDEEGYIISQIGDQPIAETSEKVSQLVLGATRHESICGTGGIGTAIALKKPVLVWGNEHYIKSHQSYTCCAAPIVNSSDELIGCLNITGLSSEVHTHTLGMIISAVDGITKELKMKEAYEQIERISKQKNTIIEAISSGLILLNEQNEIIQINGMGLEMFDFTKEEVLGNPISQLLSFDESESFEQFLRDRLIISDKETSIQVIHKQLLPKNYIISIKALHSAINEYLGCVIILKEAEYVHKLANKISGYKPSFTFSSIVGSSSIINSLIAISKRAAQGSSNVLILGESGTGKELIAQSIHNASGYSGGPFIAINCGALPKGLVQSELFGFEKGSFTGANKEGHPGKFELADGGTLFLDEIGDLPLDVQAVLLRVLQNKEIVRIGGKHAKKVNVRIVAATNTDLRKAIQEKVFREDLYYRLNVLTINVPPLRERGNDIIELAQYFAKGFMGLKKKITYDEEVLRIFQSYGWPGNVRELENVVERAINVTDSGRITATDLPEYLVEASLKGGKNIQGSYHTEESVQMLDLEDKSKMICALLNRCGGNVQQAANELGISRRTLYRKIEKYHIKPENYRL